jgi:hypothetical protein
MFTIGHFLSFPLYYYLAPLGTIILAIGIVLMTHFIQKYPSNPNSGRVNNEPQQKQRR